MKNQAVILTLLGALASVPPVAAQRADLAAGTVEHVDGGVLQSIDTQRNQIVIASNDGGEQTYDFGPETRVEGLGQTMRLTTEVGAQNEGSIVRVIYANVDQRFLARQVYFTGEREIRVTEGTISSIDRAALVLTDPQGREERMMLDFGPGVAIDSDAGLLDPSELEVGQRVRVYYARRSGQATGFAYLIRMADG